MTHSIIVPGDKSITHRALFLAASIPGESAILGALSALDTRSTARVLRGLGVQLGRLTADRPISVVGRSEFRTPGSPLDCGNSGTTARLVMGLLAASPFRSQVTGDRSLVRRPMRRVTEPLSQMGVQFAPPLAERLPLAMRGGRLQGIRWPLPVSSAQLKTALLFAGVRGGVAVAVREPNGQSRDHTERMLRALGASVVERDGWIEYTPGDPLKPFHIEVPGDPSSAAFLLGAALLTGKALALDKISQNPTRLGYLEVFRRMGAHVDTATLGESLGEPVGRLVVYPSRLVAARVLPAEVPGLIDEIPLLAVLAARAQGTSSFEQVGELRVKESDRLALIADNLQTLGYQASSAANILRVTGSDHPPIGRIQTDGDHRIAMAFACLGLVKGAKVAIEDQACVAVSFPDFFDALRVVQRLR